MLEGLFRDQARARQAHGQTAPGRTLPENLPERGETRDAIASLAAVSGRTIDKVKSIQSDAIKRLVMAADPFSGV